MDNDAAILASLKGISDNVCDIKKDVKEITRVNAKQDTKIAVLEKDGTRFESHIKNHWKFVSVVCGFLAIIGVAIKWF